MTHMRIKLVVAAVVLLSAAGYLAVAGIGRGWIYMLPVDQFLADSQYHSQRVRLTGIVSREELDASPGKATARFRIAGEKESLAVVYRGVLPDMFRADAEVIAEGRLDAKGTFVADTLMTKCASKYEARPANHPAATEQK
ncbi:MAG: cytochrome c maturation protein CcmE [Phycisphaeraceae bacterium]|nr:cytochrome c maturation protein CcmE [Phycisphaeraceae bacterium]